LPANCFPVLTILSGPLQEMISWSPSGNSESWQKDSFYFVADTEIRTVCDNTAGDAGRVRLRLTTDGKTKPNSQMKAPVYGYTDVQNWLVYPMGGNGLPECQSGELASYVTEHLHAQWTTADYHLELVPLE
jgi:hypothetical protein